MEDVMVHTALIISEYHRYIPEYKMTFNISHFRSVGHY